MACVLVADDSWSIRMLIRQILVADGHTVVEASRGDVALQLLRDVRPDLAILDVMMPGLDGLSACRAARENSSLHELRIIIVSSSATSEAAHDAGADHYLPKPFSTRELRAAVVGLAGAHQPST